MITFIVCPEQKCQYGVTKGNEFFNGKGILNYPIQF